MKFAAVIFDFGGVITSSPFEAFNRLEKASGVPLDSVRRINSANPDTNAWAQFERSEIDAAGFDHAFAEEAARLDVDLRGADVLRCLAGDIRPAMVSALDRLKQSDFKIGCITNNVPSGKGSSMALDDAKAEAVAQIMKRFDHVIESSKVGIRKPDPAIYIMMCEALEVTPQECIYLDDLGINCKPAAGLGMAAIKVNDEHEALDKLGLLIGLCLL